MARWRQRKGLARWMFEARHEDGKRLGNSAGRGRGFGEQDRPLAPNHGMHEAEDVCTCRPTWAISFVTVLAQFIVIVLAFEIQISLSRWGCHLLVVRHLCHVCVCIVSGDGQAHGTCRACVQAVDDSRARRACARAWALACARTQQTRRENRSRQVRQAHARGMCGVRLGQAGAGSRTHATSAARKGEPTPDF
ncbi:hypothetical protein HAX54_011064 [Datura stramonium]|uniref:Uncharacterized protein n=1 Tax=Datura stramonium TaxID=4076 RepID=A0ABS8TJ53_DATST|nr:hypothetical protein [Datura stramonium]